MQQPDSPDIDAVITWVDGADPEHQRRLLQFTGSSRGGNAAADPTRFGDCGEIAYCVWSLLRFAPWLRRIHIVSDRQVPAVMQAVSRAGLGDRVRVVDHSEIFAGYEQHLPTFSNRSIEAMLWRIPGLADRFIYLNDDFSVIRPVQPGDFFHADGVVLRGHWRPSRGSSRLRGLVDAMAGGIRRLRAPGVLPRPGNHVAQELSARMAGSPSRFFQVPHCPHPVRKAVLADYFSRHPQALDANIAYRLRSAGQFLAVSLANHLELAAGTAIIDNRLAPLRLKPSTQSVSSLRKQLDAAMDDPRIAFACVQSLDQASPAARELVLGWLEEVVGVQ